MLEVKNLSFFYEKRLRLFRPKVKIPIFENLNFSLKRGENLLIYGSSGSGKSTLGKMIAGILKTQEGEIWLEERRLTDLMPQKIQYVFQDQKTALNPHRKIESLLKDVSEKIEVELLEAFVLDECILQRKVDTLSRGEAQRVGLLRALMVKPSILICDEVMDALDLESTQQILEILKTYQEKNKISYIFISHRKELLQGLYQQILHL